jgi:hypothetical protein
MLSANAICRSSASAYCGASAPVASTTTLLAPDASAASQTSMPVAAMCCSRTGMTRAGSPGPRRPMALISALPAASWNRMQGSRPPAAR